MQQQTNHKKILRCRFSFFLTGMVGACFVMFALSILYEGLKFTREHLLRRAAARSAVVYTPSVSANSREQMVGTVEPSIR